MAGRRNRRGAGDYDPLINSALGAYRRLDQRAQVIVLIVLLVAGALAAGIVYYQQRHAAQTGPQGPVAAAGPALSPQMLLGNPSEARADGSDRANFLMLKPYYALSYNDPAGTPNWVSWRVTAADLGSAPRKQLFDADKALPGGFKVITHRDYSGSGFDRGHLCPHSDRAATQEMSFATFVMTNIIPQAPNVNQRAWAQLENYCRELVRQRQHLYVISGPAGRGGRGSMGLKETIAGGRVTVPAECWKIVVVVPDGGGGGGGADDDLAKIGARTRVITVIMPNDNDAVGEAWAPFRTNAAAVEGRTGHHFFDRVSPEVAEALRQRVDDVPIAPPHPLGHGGDGG
jgi:endonuclease G